MSGVAVREYGQGEGAFNRNTMLLIAAIGTLTFIAMLVLGAYAPDLRSGKNGGAHALSNAATGFSAIVRLAEATGRNPVIVRSQGAFESEDLAVITPEAAATPLGDILERRGPRATLIVLPKWATAADELRPGWVRVPGLVPVFEPEGVLAPTYELKLTRRKTQGEPLRTVAEGAPAGLRFLAPSVTQSIRGANLQPLITDERGGVILGKVGDRPLYVLADPDLLNNHGMGDSRQAAGAVAMLDYLNSTNAESILFDVTANGLGGTRSPLKLAFDPPFLGVTLTIFAAMLLAAIQATVRFGSPHIPERAIAFGKAALVDNSAALIRKAGREASLGSRYVDVIRQRAVQLFRLAPTLSNDMLDQRLEWLNPRRSFSELARAMDEARNRGELVARAQSLHHWIEEVHE
jgi:hypothetical protein